MNDNRSRPGHVLTVCANKGGTGKTTTAAAITQAAIYRGFKALAVDLDPQGNFSFALAAKSTDAGSSYDLLTGTPAADLIQTTAQGADVITASPNLATVKSGRGSARRLRDALEPVKRNYDFIIIDTPSTAGELQFNALRAAEGLIIPLNTDTYNIQSLYQITDAARQITARDQSLSFIGAFINKFDARANYTKFTRDLLAERAAALGVHYLGAVRMGVCVAEAAGFQESLFEYAPKGNPTKDFLTIFDAICSKIEEK